MDNDKNLKTPETQAGDDGQTPPPAPPDAGSLADPGPAGEQSHARASMTEDASVEGSSDSAAPQTDTAVDHAAQEVEGLPKEVDASWSDLDLRVERSAEETSAEADSTVRAAQQDAREAVEDVGERATRTDGSDEEQIDSADQEGAQEQAGADEGSSPHVAGEAGSKAARVTDRLIDGIAKKLDQASAVADRALNVASQDLDKALLAADKLVTPVAKDVAHGIGEIASRADKALTPTVDQMANETSAFLNRLWEKGKEAFTEAGRVPGAPKSSKKAPPDPSRDSD